MSTQKETDRKLSCNEARQRFASLIQKQGDEAFLTRDGEAVASHLKGCRRCSQEYRLRSLTRLALDLTASPEAIEPGKEFFVQLRARIARGPEAPARYQAEESWSATLWLTARQMMPALAMLLLLIIGATILWSRSSATDRSGEAQAVELQTKVRGLT